MLLMLKEKVLFPDNFGQGEGDVLREVAQYFLLAGGPDDPEDPDWDPRVNRAWDSALKTSLAALWSAACSALPVAAKAEHLLAKEVCVDIQETGWNYQGMQHRNFHENRVNHLLNKMDQLKPFFKGVALTLFEIVYLTIRFRRMNSLFNQYFEG